MKDTNKSVIKGYELRELIGKGGTGAVYRAYQPVVEREVAIKVILPQYANHPDFIRRFNTEAQLVARLEHPFIVPLYDYWREPDGAYLVMRYLRGGSLRDRLAEKPLTLSEGVRLVEQIGSALMIAHRNGVVHRDLKPANILLDEEGNAFLADFGIAKVLSGTAGTTHEGEVIGTPAYLSPEQIQGMAVTPSTDIYCLGIVLYEMLSGELPFPSDTPGTLLLKHLQEPLPLLETTRPDIPPALDKVIQRATAKAPAARYPDTMSLAEDFRKAAEGELRALADKSVTPVPPRWRKGKPAWMSTDEWGAPRNPYKGLRAFQQADAADFFGRESLVAQLLERLKEEDEFARFLAVVGPSGCGKSSVVKAGLIPALQSGGLPDSENWFVAELLPGMHPLEELEIALTRIAVKTPAHVMEHLQRDERGLLRAARILLPDDHSQLLLVIDQFEELFTLVEDPAIRAHFLANLSAAITDPRSPVRVIITLRADFYDKPLMYGDFGKLFSQRTQVVLPLKPEEIERAIVEPSASEGMVLEPALVSALVADVSDQPGALPLLQYTLTELFECRKDHTLTLEAYHAIGGTLGALAQRAEEGYESLDEASKAATQQLFLRLITLGEGTEDTRRRVLQAELLTLGDTKTMQQVIDFFGKLRMLTFDRDPVTRGPTVEVAHEAILREWERLRMWLSDSRNDVRLQRLLAAAAEEWRRANRDTGFLLYNSRLAQFDEWVDQPPLALTDAEREFLNASIAEQKRQEAQEQERQARERALERRSRNALRVLVVVLLAATLGAIALSLLAFDREEQAEKARDVADQSAAEAQSMFWATSAQQAAAEGNTVLAIPLALAANQIKQPSALAQSTLAQVAYAQGARRRFGAKGEGHTDLIEGVAFSPDGQTALSASLDGRLILWDIQTGSALRTFVGHTDYVWSVAFSPDGQTALSASWDKTLILWDIKTGEALRTFEGHTDKVRRVVFSPDGETALSASNDRTLILWDVETGKPLHSFEGHTDTVEGAAFSPDGQTALSASRDFTLILWDIETGEVLRTFAGHRNGVISVAFSPDGQTALSGSEDNTLILWDVETGEALRTFEGHTAWISSVTFSPDGQTALSSSGDSSVILWDIETGKALHTFRGHTGSVGNVAFSPDGRQALSGSDDHTLILWDTQRGERLRVFQADIFASSVDFSPDSETALSGTSDGPLILWDIATGEAVRTFEGHSKWVNSVAFSPDGGQALSASEDGSIILWNIETGQAIRTFEGHTDWISSVVFSPDGKTALSGSGDATVILWKVETGTALRTFQGHTEAVNSVAFSPDGRWALSGSKDQTLALWNIETGERTRVFEGHTAGINNVAFSPDGKTVLSASWDTTLILWDVQTGSALYTLRGHTAPVMSVAYSPKDAVAVSAAGDGTLMIWDLKYGERLHVLEGHTSWIYSVAFSPDGQTVLSASDDYTLMLWRIDTLDELIAWTRDNRYIRNFTCEERTQYHIKPLCE